MLVWIVNPFDPLPGDPDEPEGRYATLARALVANGHRVCWWTSDFSHRFKRPIDQSAMMAVCNPIGIELQFMRGISYYQNFGLRRVLNHYQLSKFFQKNAGKIPEQPDVIVASSPPPLLAYQASRFAKDRGVKMIIDIQDWWSPEGFCRVIPGWLQPFCSVVLQPWLSKTTNAYELADFIVGLTETYIEDLTKLTGAKHRTAVIPLGLDYQLFDSVVSRGSCQEFTKPAGETWFTYAGSLTRSHDFITLTKAFAKVEKELGIKARLFIAGQGELSEELTEIIREQRLTNVIQTGFLDITRLAYLLTQCDVGFNPSWPKTMIYLPYKLFYYFAGSLAILNTMPGECSRILAENQCGLDYEAGDVNSCAQAIKEIVSDRDRLSVMQQNSRRLAETAYNRKLLYQRYVHLIEEL